MDRETLDYLRSFGEEYQQEAFELLCELARIPAPSHHEEKRAAFVCDWMQRNGMTGAYVDDAKNVICALGDDGQRGLTVFAAHTDVVFPDTDELPVRVEGGKLIAPGVGDDTANLVVLLLAARHISQHPELIPEGKAYLIVANSCEEGLGNLKGTKQLFADYGERIERYYSFDLYMPGYVAVAVGSHRWKINVKTQGGHSYADFGMPNAIERLCTLVAALYQMKPPTTAYTTFNVGSIEGGTTVNAIASDASCLFEYRSASDAALQDMRSQFERIVDEHRERGVSIEVEEVGIRPASCDGPSEELARTSKVTAEVVHAITGILPVKVPLSTDANIPLSMGIPANTVGAIRGSLLHTRDEWVEIASIKDGLRMALGIMLAQKEL